MKIMIIGNGAKELAALKVLEEKGHHEAHIVPGNSASKFFERMLGTTPVEMDDYRKMTEAANTIKPDLIMILDEMHCRYPVRDELDSMGFKVFAPSQKAADLLYDKEKWTSLFRQEQLSIPDSQTFNSYDEIYSAIQESEGPWVLTRLKNPNIFTICYSEEEAQDTLDEWYSQDENTSVMLTDYIDGTRFNIPCMVYGENLVPISSTIIQRGMYEQEDDAQLKGLGAFSPADAVDPAVIKAATEEILKPFVKAMKEEGKPYTGFMSGEFVVSDGKPVCVNVKCGLPDCGSILTFLRQKDDLAACAISLMEGKEIHPSFYGGSAALVVMTAKDYPEHPSLGVPITMDEDFEGFMFPHHVHFDENGNMTTCGGRVMFVAAMGKNRQEASRKAVESCSHIHCDDLIYRTDIGQLVNEDDQEAQ